jgi:hypothetical protein
MHLGLLAGLLELARPGALFPDARRVREWVALVRTPWKGRTAPRIEVHATGGFPSPRSLERLLERQRLARAFFTAHRTRPARSSDQFNTALAAAELWSPGTEARVMAAERGASRLLVVHDRYDAATGVLSRFTVQVEQRGGKHLKLERGTTCSCSPAFVRAVEQACDDDATAAAVRLGALDGLTIYEVVKGELGPFASSVSGAHPGVTVAGDEAVLSLVLERVGATVSADHRADAWPPADPHVPGRATHDWHLSRERKLICTPGLEAALKPIAAAARMLLRCR